MSNVSSSNSQGELVPELRFPEFSEEWKVERLSDFATRVTRKNSENESTLPLTISSKDGLVDQISYFNKTVASKDLSGYYLLKKGEYAYNKSYSVGYNWGSIKRLEHYDMGALSTLYICFSLKNHNSNYINTYFDSLCWYKEIQSIAAEGARNHGLLNISTKDFFETKHILPNNIKEQEKIAQFFELITQRIRLQEKLLDSLKSYKRGLLSRLFPKNEDTVPELRFSKFTANWEQRKLGICCDQIKETVNPQLTPDKKFVEYSMPAFDNDNGPNIVSGDEMNSIRKVINTPCLLINKLNVRKKRIWLVENPEDNAVCSAEFVPVYSNNVSLQFLKYVVMEDKFTKYLEDCSSGSSNSQKRVTPDIIMDAKIMLPKIDEQVKIGVFLNNLDNLITLHQEKWELYANIKNALLQKMFI